MLGAAIARRTGGKPGRAILDVENAAGIREHRVRPHRDPGLLDGMTALRIENPAIKCHRVKRQPQQEKGENKFAHRCRCPESLSELSSCANSRKLSESVIR